MPVPRPARLRGRRPPLLLRPRGGRRRRSSSGSRPAGCSPSSARRAAASRRSCAPASSPRVRERAAPVSLLTPGSRPALDVADEPDRLVVVDQFEELFTLCDDADRRRAFIDGLLALRCAVAIGVRADFYGRLSAHGELARAVAGQPGAARRDDRRRARARDHGAGAAGRPEARAGPGRARAARRRGRARGAAAALARAARHLGAARRPHAHRRGLPRERRRRLGDRAHRRRRRRRAARAAAASWRAACSCG